VPAESSSRRLLDVPLSARLPDFPWDLLRPYGDRARAHPDGIVDLSIGTPVDPTPALVQAALTAAADSPGYPLVHGTPELRAAVARWVRRRLAAEVDPVDVVATVGSKELVAALPLQLGLGAGAVVVVPELAYPTYAVGALAVGAEVVTADSLVELGPRRVDLVWVNSPSNPTGRVLPAAHLAKVVAWARERGAVVVSDECYVELGWTAEPVSVLHPDVNGGSHDGVLAVHSLSKRSNLAGYRAGFVTGDPRLVAELVAIRKHLGVIVPGPVQAAMVAALDDDAHVVQQRARYAARRDRLLAAFAAAGFAVEHSEAGLYLWATAEEPCWDTVARLADLGILVAPGDFYGPRGTQHVRIALTVTDERVDAATRRLS
jgi:succinyldiaminopimelate transaminase